MGNTNDLTPPCTRCQSNPCGCVSQENCTKCDRDTKNNVWLERGPFPGDDLRPGICLLDTMQPYQVIYVLEHDWRAQKDLLRVTSCEYLLYLANNVTLLPTQELVDMEQNFLNRANQKEAYPFYGVFAGNPPTAQPRKEGDPVDDD